MAQALERIIQHREFQALPYEEQVGLMSNILGQVSPDLASDGEALTTASEKAIRTFRPRTGFEKVGSFLSGFIPIAGPLIQQYGFDENVPPPALLSMMGITDDDNPYGGLIRAGLDIPLMVAGGIAGGIAVGQASKYLPSLLNRTLPAMISRELIAGAASGTGELVLDPPSSTVEGAARLGLSAIGQAALTTTGRKLFGVDARTERAFKNDLGEDGFKAFNQKLQTGNARDITDHEIGALERALGDRKDEYAVSQRQMLTDIKQRRSILFEQDEMARNTEQLRFAEEQKAAELAGRTERMRFVEEKQVETERLTTDIRAQALRDQLSETNTRAQEQMAEGASRANQAELETNRKREVDGLIRQTEAGPVERGETQLLQSESQLVSLLNERQARVDENETFPLINNEPVTLPMAMIQDLGGGNNRAVVVERMDGARADLRYLGPVDRQRLRLPNSLEEEIAIRRINAEQGIGAFPSYTESRRILQSRIEGERSTRLANIEAGRFNSGEASVQREIFSLRKEATLSYLEAHNGEVSVDVRDKIKKTIALDGKRIAASAEGLSAADAEAASKALRSAGFENVRTSLTPEGTFNIAFSNQATSEAGKATGLYSRYSTFKGTIDPTSGATYGGLTPAEHGFLRKSMGMGSEQVAKFNGFVEQYAKELRDRGIRFPVTTEAMGVDLIEDQLGRKAPMKMRSEVIARSTEDVRRIEIGDVIEYPGQQGRVQLWVAGKDQTHDPDGSGLGTITYRTVPIETLAEMQTSPEAMPTIPLTEKQLIDIQAKRSVEFPISPEQQPKFSLESPSRNIGDLFGLQRSQMPSPSVEGTESAMRSAAGELGLKVNVGSDGSVRLTGQKVDLKSLTAEDASLILTRLKQMKQDRSTLLDFFKGCV